MNETPFDFHPAESEPLADGAVAAARFVTDRVANGKNGQKLNDSWLLRGYLIDGVRSNRAYLQ